MLHTACGAYRSDLSRETPAARTFVWQADGQGEWCDVVIDDRIEGITLYEAVMRSTGSGDKAHLGTLARQFDRPAPELPESDRAHGDLYYNGDSVFYLGLKDAARIEEYGITFYIALAPTNPLQLASGDYPGGAAGTNMTFDLAKSFWNYNDPTYGIIKNKITEGTLRITANGNDDYTITGAFKAIDEVGKNTELEIEYTGKLPCEDYSY